MHIGQNVLSESLRQSYHLRTLNQRCQGLNRLPSASKALTPPVPLRNAMETAEFLYCCNDCILCLQTKSHCSKLYGRTDQGYCFNRSNKRQFILQSVLYTTFHPPSFIIITIILKQCDAPNSCSLIVWLNWSYNHSPRALTIWLFSRSFALPSRSVLHTCFDFDKSISLLCEKYFFFPQYNLATMALRFIPCKRRIE